METVGSDSEKLMRDREITVATSKTGKYYLLWGPLEMLVCR